MRFYWHMLYYPQWLLEFIIRPIGQKNNSQHAVSASKNNNIRRSAQSISITHDRRVNRCTLDAYLLRCTSCVVIFARTHYVQIVHLIIFYPIVFLSPYA